MKAMPAMPDTRTKGGIMDWKFWRGPAPEPAMVQLAYEGESRVR